MGFKFERLEVWQKAIDFANTMFDIADALPQRYQFSLGEQLRRAALSISTNIAHKIGATRAWGMDLHMRCCTTIGALKMAKDMMIADPDVGWVWGATCVKWGPCETDA
jgi:hypothetical protein